ncbi:amidase [Pelagibius litoralis]|uniref:Amidase n=1 Tax=Pelagibius litoralis TaxID=374515 RepID=A0A967C1M1_9PROT|nr:amidase [Pelagibius litoralis]
MAEESASAAEQAAAIAAGSLRSVDLVKRFLDRIAAGDEAVQAWAHLDPDYALRQAQQRDDQRGSGLPLGPLHGVPVGLKDIVDTADMPTENGTPLDAGRQPRQDATLVSRLRAAGAVILGKTVSTELAFYAPGKTRNPHDPERTPGGSSSGSAAAVAAGQVPLAVGTQTNGSVIRPASFCGVVGYKPSHGLVSRHGLLSQSPPLDTVGAFARTVEDAALIVDAMAGHDPADGATRPMARPCLLQTARAAPPVKPSFALVKGPTWDAADADTKDGLAELRDFLGEDCDEVTLPSAFERAHDLQRLLMVAGFAKNLAPYYEKGRDRLSDVMRAAIEEGRTVLAVDYALAEEWIDVLNAGLAEIFERYDAILTPAAVGEAPQGLSATGDPTFCTLWTLCGTPAITLPLLQGAAGLPIGVQIVGARGDDARLLRSARWLAEALAVEDG